MGALFRLSCLAVLIAVAGQPRAQGPTRRTPVARATPPLQSGDVVLQTSSSSRSALIRKASQSPYSHVGLIEVAPDGVFVIEAVQPVSRTPWSSWRARGVGGRVTVLRPTDLSAESAAAIVAAAKAELGKPYDARYRWDDERLYCSELVTKAYERGAGRTVGRQEQVSTLSLSAADLELGRRLGVDPSQTLVTPASLAEDAAFTVVHTDF